MATRTVYVKNEKVWETAKSIAGNAGLSGFVEEALERLITAKRREQAAIERFDFEVKPIDGSDQIDHQTFRERLGFDGKRLADWFVLSIYRTKAGKFIVTDNLMDAEGAIYGYRIYDQLAELRNDRAITNLPEDEQSRLWDTLSEPPPPPVVTTWID